MLLGCTPSSVADAEKKKSVAWLANNGSPEAIAALGRVADDDKAAAAALDALSQATVGKNHTDGGASALDVYIAVWAGVERNAAWALTMTKSALGDALRMNDMASAMKRGSPQLGAFVPDLDGALAKGGDAACASALASADGAVATSAIEKRLTDSATRDAMCEGVGSSDSSKAARDVFMRVPESSRNAIGCTGAAARLAARDDVALAWLAKTAEPGLMRSVAQIVPCDRLARLWTTVFTSREHATFGALTRSLEDSIKQCPKDLDAPLSAALGADSESQTLVVMAVDPRDSSVRDLKSTCAVAASVASRVTSPVARARAADLAARCK